MPTITRTGQVRSFGQVIGHVEKCDPAARNSKWVAYGPKHQEWGQYRTRTEAVAAIGQKFEQCKTEKAEQEAARRAYEAQTRQEVEAREAATVESATPAALSIPADVLAAVPSEGRISVETVEGVTLRGAWYSEAAAKWHGWIAERETYATVGVQHVAAVTVDGERVQVLAPAQPTDHAEIVEWEDYEGGVIGYNSYGDSAVEIDALQDRAKCAKWGEPYRPGRGWSVTLEDGTIRRGHSDNLRTAKRDALARLADAATTRQSARTIENATH